METDGVPVTCRWVATKLPHLAAENNSHFLFSLTALGPRSSAGRFSLGTCHVGDSYMSLSEAGPLTRGGWVAGQEGGRGRCPACVTQPWRHVAELPRPSQLTPARLQGKGTPRPPLHVWVARARKGMWGGRWHSGRFGKHNLPQAGRSIQAIG